MPKHPEYSRLLKSIQPLLSVTHENATTNSLPNTEDIVFDPQVESPDEYIMKLKTRFPAKEQQIFLEAFWQAVQVCFLLPLIAAPTLMDNEPLGYLEKYFPSYLNAPIKELSDHPEDLKKIRMKMARVHTVPIILSANLAIDALKKLEKDILKNTKAAIKDIITGRTNTILNTLPFTTRWTVKKNAMVMQAVEKVMGPTAIEMEIDHQLDQLITAEWLQLQLPKGIDGFKYIRDNVAEAFDPFAMSSAVVNASLAMLDLDFPPGIEVYIYEAAELAVQQTN